ncbi:MAG: SulP family inorganic anion transporter [Microbacteriaceae bacterium]
MRRRARAKVAFLRGLLPAGDDFRAMKRAPVTDLIAGLTVAIVALPLALAFGEASGLGAQAGVITAVIAGAIAAFFGGSNLQVSGPTGAMTVVLLPVVHQFGVSGVLQVGLMAGVILIALALSGVGRYVRYLPSSLIEGFTAGIAVVIAMQQVPNMLGLRASDQEHVWAIAGDAVMTWIANPDLIPLLIAGGVASVILLGSRLKPGWPLSLVAVVAATALSQLGDLGLPEVGALPALFSAPTADFFDATAITALLPSALAIAALAALESLLCATVADAMSVGERHNPDRELFGQGLANLVVPLFGGVPATAAIARTAVNVRAGAQSRLSALSHSVVLIAFVMVASPLVGGVPLAALAGVLLATTIQMVQLGAIKAILTSSPSDAAVLLITFGVTVAIDLVAAVALGLALAGLLALRAVARASTLEVETLDHVDYTAEQQKLLTDRIVAYRLEGALFFGAAHRFLLELSEVSNVSVVILRMSRVNTIDATGALMLDDAIRRLEKRGIVVLISGIKPGHERVLDRLGSATRLRSLGRVFVDTPDAIHAAREAVTG